MKKVLTNQEIRLGGMIPLYIKDQYDREIHKFLSGKLDPKYYTYEQGHDCTDMLLKQIDDLLKVIRIQNNRIGVLNILTYEEIQYLKNIQEEHLQFDEFDTQQQIDTCFSMLRTLSNVRESIKKELNHKYKIMKHIETIDLNPEATLTKAIKYIIRKSNERFQGKYNPINVLIQEQIALTPYSAYNIKLMAKNKSIWDDAKERLNMPIYLTDIANPKDPIDPDEKEQPKFQDLLNYVYQNKKFNYMERRLKRYTKSQEKIEKEQQEKKEKAEARKQALLDKHLNTAIERYNNWYIKEKGMPPIGYSDLLTEAQDIDEIYILLGVIKKEHGYAEGYVEKDLNTLNGKMLNIWFAPTKEEAEKAMQQALQNNILAATIICLAYHSRTNKSSKLYTSMHITDMSRYQYRDNILKEQYMQHVINDFIKGYAIGEIINDLPIIYDEIGEPILISENIIKTLINITLNEKHVHNRYELIALTYNNDLLSILQNGGWCDKIEQYLKDMNISNAGRNNIAVIVLYYLMLNNNIKCMGPVIMHEKELIRTSNEQNPEKIIKQSKLRLSKISTSCIKPSASDMLYFKSIAEMIYKDTKRE